MAVFDFFLKSSPTHSELENRSKATKGVENAKENGGTPTVSPQAAETEQEASTKPLSKAVAIIEVPQVSPEEPVTDTLSPDTSNAPPDGQVQQSFTRGFSFRSLAFLSNRDKVKPALSAMQEHEKKGKVSDAFFKRQAKVLQPDKRAKQSALVVRSLIVGSLTDSSPGPTQTVTKHELNQVKSQLMQPKAANEVIAQLRALPAFDRNAGETREKKDVPQGKPAGPIHAVCLDTTDKEVEERHFSQLANGKEDATTAFYAPSVATASIEKLSKMFKDMKIVTLIKSPDFGLGQSGDGDGILSGAVPTAATVINGIEQMTPQLMALAFANSIWPDHKGIYPPTDRMSVLTYWWGLELVLPDASIQYLSNVQSIAQTIMNFLTAMSIMNNGVREILPFIRYISQFVEFEFSMIKGQNHGQGVVCAATWIMPAAMVPRPWDFATPPPEATQDLADKDASTIPSIDQPRTSQGTTFTVPSRPSNVTICSEATSGPIPSMPPVLPEVVVDTPSGTANYVFA